MGELNALTAGARGSIPGRGTKIPQAVQCGRKKIKERKKEMHRRFTIRKVDTYGVDQRPSYRGKNKNCMIISTDTENLLNKNKQS